MLAIDDDVSRVGVVIARKGSWRDTVVHYAKIKNVVPQAIKFYDDLIDKGWMEPWAALRAIDEVCCADIIVGSLSFSTPSKRNIN